MLEAKKLCKQYHNKFAVHNLSFSVAPGEIFCLLGQNGAGKTTTINIFLGLLSATSGEALINNKSVFGNTSSRSSIAYIPEKVELYSDFSALENLDFFSRLAGFVYTKEKLAQLLHEVNLQENTFQKNLLRTLKECNKWEMMNRNKSGKPCMKRLKKGNN